MRGTYDTDRLEAVNAEQLVTVTDRLLVLGPRRLARGSAPYIPPAMATRRERFEPTVLIRRPRPRAKLAAIAWAVAIVVAAILLV